MQSDRHHSESDDGIENDPVWSLLSHSASRTAGPRFADDVVRKARLGERGPVSRWWNRWFTPLPAMAAAGIAAALVAGFFLASPSAEAPREPGRIVLTDEEAEAENLAHLQEVLETEMLFVAVEHLDDFSDAELISLIGF